MSDISTKRSFSDSRIAKNTIFLYIRMIVVLLVSLYTTRVVLNVLGVNDYGIYSVVAGFVQMFAFLNTAMNNTIQRFYSFEKGTGTIESLNRVFNTAVRIQLLLSIIVLFLSEIIGIWYINCKMVLPKERLSAANWVFQFSVISLIILIMQIPYSAAIISHEKMNFFAVLSVVDSVLKLGIALILPYVEFDKLIFYSFLLLCMSIVSFLLYYIYAKHFDEIKFKWRFNDGEFKEMLSFTGWNTLESISYTIQGQGLNMVLNSFFGPVVNAARGLAFRIQGAINGFSSNIATAFRPQLVESYAVGDVKRTQRLLFSMTKYCYVMLFVLSLPIVLELPTILRLWLKGIVPDYTIPFTYLVIVNMLINSFNMPITQTVLATGNVKTYQIVRSFLNTSPLPISWIFLKMGYSPIIVFWIVIVVSIANQFVSMIILHKSFNFNYFSYLKEVVLPCFMLTLISPIIPILIVNFMDESLLRLFLVVTFSFTISIILVYNLVLNKTEKKAIMQKILCKIHPIKQ